MIPARKRTHSSDDDHTAKHSRCSYTFVLQSESDQHSTDDESTYSVQQYSTASAKDTSDTNSTINSDVGIEYEVASSDDTATTSDEVLCAVGVFAADPEFWADSSDSHSSWSGDSEVPKADYWTCLNCKCTNNNPLYRYCEKCYQIRKNYLSERPRRGLRQKTTPAKTELVGMDEKELPSASQVQCFSLGNSENLGDNSVLDKTRNCNEETANLIGRQDSLPVSDSAIESDLSQNLLSSTGEPSRTVSDLCIMCMERPTNAVFVHKKIGHEIGCYACAIKTWNRTRKCPLCNMKPMRIIRLIKGGFSPLLGTSKRDILDRA